MLKISILLYLIIPTSSISLFICFLNNVVSLNNYHYDQILMVFFGVFFNQLFFFFYGIGTSFCFYILTLLWYFLLK